MRRSYAGGANTLTLANPIDNGAAAFSSASAPIAWTDGSGGPFSITLNRGTPLGGVEEKVLCSALAGGVFTVLQRGYDGTSPASHSAGESIELTLTAIDLDEANAHINTALGVHGLAGGDRVAGIAAAQTFTNKAIDGLANTLTNIPRLASPEIDAKLTALDAVNATQDATAATKVPLAGGTMTGLLILSGDPAAALGAASKQYVDAEATARAAADATLTSTKVAKAGDTMTGLLVLSGDPGAALGAATKQYVDAQVNALKPTPVWLTPTFGAHIVDFDASTYFGPRYYKDQFGIVRLRGLGKANGAVAALDIVLTLPAGYRPGIKMVFTGVQSGSFIAAVSPSNVGVATRLDIDIDGTVVLPDTTLAANNWFSLNGITFLAEN